MIAQKGLNSVTVDVLVQEITPKARRKLKIIIRLVPWGGEGGHAATVVCIVMVCTVGSVLDYVKN